MLRSLTAAGFALMLTLAACQKQGSPEQVADAFVDAYFRRADQEKAKEYTALGATEMLDAELRSVAQIRKDGYTPQEASGAEVVVRRGEVTRREHRIRIQYEIVVKVDGGESVRNADVELTSLQGTWKVVRVGMKNR